MQMTFTAGPGPTRVQRAAHALKAIRAVYGNFADIGVMPCVRHHANWTGSPFWISASEPDGDGLMTLTLNVVPIEGGLAEDEEACSLLAIALARSMGDAIGFSVDATAIAGDRPEAPAIPFTGALALVRACDLWALTHGLKKHGADAIFRTESIDVTGHGKARVFMATIGHRRITIVSEGNHV